MPELDTTLEDAASVDTTEQPAADQAVPAEQQAATTTDQAAPEAPASQPPLGRLIAGKWKTIEEAEKGYAESTSEAMRLYRENQELLKRVQTPAKTETPSTYTPEQLATMKGQLYRLQAKAIAEGDEAKIAEYSGNLAWVDSQLVEARVAGMTRNTVKQSAEQYLRAEGMKYIQPYAAEFQPGQPLHQPALEIHQALVNYGLPDNEVTGGMAAMFALMKSGRLTAGVESKARQDLAKEAQTKLKQSVVTGQGGAHLTGSQPVTPQDIANMTKAQFAEYKRSLGIKE